jgi:hypothetical protein
MEPNAEPTQPEAIDPKERINNQVAITVAILACFMAITKVKDDNICQAMEREKANEVNTWSYYQSKSVKQNLAELGRTQLDGLARTASGETKAEIDRLVTRYNTEITRYDTEKAEIKTKAEQHAKNYNLLNFRDDQFDLSDATLSISLVMLAVTALTGKRWLLTMAWVIGVLGATVGVAGLTGLDIMHPEWLIKLLS